MIRLIVLMVLVVLASAPAHAAPAISVSPSSVEVGTAVTATWSGIASPVATDWIGTYVPAAANTAYQSNWVYVNCTQVATSAAASGSCSIATSALAAGTYELRLLIADGFTSVATSSTFTVTSTSPAATRYITNNGLTSGSCTTSGTACRADYALSTFAAADQVFQLNCGTYQGANNLLDLNSFVPGVSGTSGHPITVQAETDGCVFIDGEMTVGRTPLWTRNNSYWTFQGFDVGNGEGNIFTDGGTGLILRRICASNTYHTEPVNTANLQSIQTAGNTSPISNSLFEDICSFGTGRTQFTEYQSGPGNVFRRWWLRYEGNPPTDSGSAAPGAQYCPPTPIFQYTYNSTTATSIYENFITIHDPEQYNTSTWVSWSTCDTGVPYKMAVARREPNTGVSKMRGFISYGYDGFTIEGMTAQNTNSISWMDENNGNMSIQDYFLDSRSQAKGYGFLLNCASSSTNCSADRLTSITRSGAPASSWDSTYGPGGAPTNKNECTTLAACPNFYTGTVSSLVGARNCFRYVDGTLTSTPLWPWPMDDRIKAALARANAAGVGGSALSGTAGSGYAANTVTSEIVNRYGSIPTECLTSSSFTPSFPVASDFPSVTVRDDFTRADSGTLGSSWTELTSDVFSIASNMAAAPASGFARTIYTDTKMQVDHEVYGTWSSVPSCCGYSTIISFAGTTSASANSQYRMELNRQASGNTLARVVKIDSGGSSTTIISDTDLGTDIVDGNSFGVRVSGTTLSIYWKWTDGIWYRVNSVTDSTLSTLPSTGVYGGIAGVTRTVIDNYGAGPFVDQPAQEPPAPPASVGAGRFGTTFPGVR